METSRTTAAPGIQKITYDDGRISYKYRYKSGGKNCSETFPNKKAATDRKREIENQKAGGGVVVGRQERKKPFGDFAVEWFEQLTGDRLNPSTITNYQAIYRRHLEPRFATKQIGSIDASDARKLKAALVAQGLHQGTVKHILGTFRRICEIAVDDKIITANPIPHRKETQREREAG